MSKKRKHKIVIRETKHVLDRNDVVDEFVRFMLSNTAEAKESLRNILFDGFKGFDNMNNSQLAMEFRDWGLDRDLPDCDFIEIKNFR